MSIPIQKAQSRTPLRFVAIGLVATVGFVAGWFGFANDGQAFERVYLLLEPACAAAMCVALLQRHLDQARWLVPLLLVGVLLNVLGRHHLLAITAVGLVACLHAIACALQRRNRAAIFSSIACCVAIACSTSFAGS